MCKKISNKDYIFTMSKNNKEILKCNSGDTVIFETNDCFSNQIENENQRIESIDFNRINPATGPLYIEEAKKDDILKIHIEEIKLSGKGVLVCGPNYVFWNEIEEKTKVVNVKDSKILFNDKLTIDINPMIGVIGVAPKEGDIPTGSPGEHGGNMDCKMIKENAVLYFKVNVDGALLSIGDLHAAMGDGEIGVSGIEISGSVKVKVEVIKNLNLPSPFLVSENKLITIASDKDLMKSCEISSKNMFNFLVNELNIEKEEAVFILTSIGDLKICQIVDPLVTTRMELPLYLLEKYNYILK